MKKFFISIALLINTVSLSSQVIPSIIGFTSTEECIEKNIPIHFLLEEESINQFIACLPFGIVVNEGGIVTNEGLILQDTETYKQDQHRLLRGNIPEKRLFFDGVLAVISSPGQENWYHWLLQVLPRLKILVESNYKFDKIYIDNLKYNCQKESLKIVCNALNIPHDKLLLFEGDILIQAKELIVPSVPFIPSKNRKLPPTWLKKFIRETFLKGDGQSEAPAKIYISRSKAKCRHIINEDKLVKVLEKNGFTTLHLEDLSPFDQAKIFYNARVIIGPHGSGFANLIFSQPGTIVIEIDHGLEGEEQRSYFKKFTALMGCNYIPFYVDRVVEEDLEKDINVDVTAFEKLMSKVLKPLWDASLRSFELRLACASPKKPKATTGANVYNFNTGVIIINSNVFF